MNQRWYALFSIAVLLAGILILYPRLMPGDATIPGETPLDNPDLRTRHHWLEALTFEEALELSLERFHTVQFHSQALGGGYLASGDPRDGTLNPLTWLTISFSPLARIKLKMILALVAAAWAIYFFARRYFDIKRVGATLAALFILILLRFWPSMISHPLDSGMLFALPALALLWALPLRSHHAAWIGLLVALSWMQTGSGVFAVFFGMLISAFAMRLNPETNRPLSPIATLFTMLGFALLFATVKFVVMADAVPSFAFMTAEPTMPTSKLPELASEMLAPFYSITTDWRALSVKIAIAFLGMIGWVIGRPANRGGALSLAIFAVLILIPDWDTMSLRRFGDRNLIGPLEAPARFFFPFFAFFTTAGFCGLGIWIADKANQGKTGTVFAGLVVAACCGLTAFGFSRAQWKPIAPALDMSAKVEEAGGFFMAQIQHSAKQFLPPIETVDPANLIPQGIGVAKAPMIPSRRLRVIGRYRFRRGTTLPIKVPRFKGEVYTSSHQLQLEHYEEWANYLRVRVFAKRPGNVIFNRNFDPAWRTDKFEVSPYRGLLSVRIKESGYYEITLAYRPFSLYFGAAITLAGFLLAIWLTILLWKRKAPTQATAKSVPPPPGIALHSTTTTGDDPVLELFENSDRKKG